MGDAPFMALLKMTIRVEKMVEIVGGNCRSVPIPRTFNGKSLFNSSVCVATSAEEF